MPATLVDTYWRNNQTGDWVIGFTERYAIYDCRLWDYSIVKRKGDKFEVMLTNDGERVKVTIDKTYSQITTGELPNYPTKNLTPEQAREKTSAGRAFITRQFEPLDDTSTSKH